MHADRLAGGQAGRTRSLVVDRLAAATALAFLAPVLAAVAVAVKLDSPGPATVTHARPGRAGAIVDARRFRTAPHRPVPALSAWPGVVPGPTRIGRLLRLTGMAELPQLFNVLNGTLSLADLQQVLRDAAPGGIPLGHGHRRTVAGNPLRRATATVRRDR